MVYLYTIYQTLNLSDILFNQSIICRKVLFSMYNVIFRWATGGIKSVQGVGRRTQPISKLLNDLSALNPTCLVQNALNPTCLLQVSDFSAHLYLGSGPL
jgi:hypothetical protein